MHSSILAMRFRRFLRVRTPSSACKHQRLIRDAGLKFEYASIPFSPWRPCLPFLERRILPIGPLALLYRYFRVFWIVVTLPTWIGVVCLFEVFPKAWGDSIGNAWLPRRKSWTRWQRFTYPILARTVWSVRPASMSQDRTEFPAGHSHLDYHQQHLR